MYYYGAVLCRGLTCGRKKGTRIAEADLTIRVLEAKACMGAHLMFSTFPLTFLSIKKGFYFVSLRTKKRQDK